MGSTAGMEILLPLHDAPDILDLPTHLLTKVMPDA
jgi:hypothetical protein